MPYSNTPWDNQKFWCLDFMCICCQNDYGNPKIVEIQQKIRWCILANLIACIPVINIVQIHTSTEVRKILWFEIFLCWFFWGFQHYLLPEGVYFFPLWPHYDSPNHSLLLRKIRGFFLGWRKKKVQSFFKQSAFCWPARKWLSHYFWLKKFFCALLEGNKLSENFF